MALFAVLPMLIESASMTLCNSCNYPIPSWQHNGACKPVAEKVPTSLRAADYPSLAKVWDNASDDVYAEETVTRVTENPPALPKRRGRPKKDASLTAAQKQAAYRARKQQ